MPMVINPANGVYRWEDGPYVQEIPAEAVPADTRELARQAVEVAKAELGLDDLTIRWFSHESDTSRRLRQKHGATGLPWTTFEADGDLQGITFGSDPSEVWVRSTLDPLEAIECVLHESRHAKQYADYIQGAAGALNMTGSPCSDQLAEIDARQWVREVTEMLIAEAEHFEQTPAATSTHQPMHRASAATARPSSPSTPYRQVYERKGVRYVICLQCEHEVPLGTTHRCRGVGAPW